MSRNVTAGQTVAASFQTPTLFLIATDLTKMQVDTNVSESDIAGASKGANANFTVDAFPDKTFRGQVAQVRQAPISVQNVITYDVVITVANPGLLLKPGMTATAKIVKAQARNVLRVPSQALRFTPTGAANNRTAKTLKGGQRMVWVKRNGKLVAIPGHSGPRRRQFRRDQLGGFEGRRSGRLVRSGKRNVEQVQNGSNIFAPPLGASGMADPVVNLIDLTRSFQLGDTEVHALQGVSISVARGEFVAIMGSSGSGKSTLMNIIGCLDQPTSGQYIFEGRDVAHLSEPQLADIRSRRIGFVFQNFNLLARTSALENVVLPLLYGAAASLTSKERNDRGRAMLAGVGLADRADNTPSQLSGGQQQRVALARALINQPAVLLADEPTGNLDTRTSHEIMDIIRKLNREQGVTVILVTHEADIGAYADRMIVMRDGKIALGRASDRRCDAGPIVRARDGRASDERGRRRTSGRRSRVSASAFLSMVFSASLQALARNKLRSALTMLGVFIGVAALIAMVAVGDGASAAVKKQLESLGTNMVVVQPGATTRRRRARRRGQRLDPDRNRRRDHPARRSRPFSGSATSPASPARSNTAIRTGAQRSRASRPAICEIVSWRIAEGSTMTEQENDAAETVCLIGQTVYQNLFPPGQSPIGAMILIKGVPMRVIGLLVGKGQTGYGQDQDDVVHDPVQHRRAQGPGRRRAAGRPEPGQHQLSAGPQRLRPHPAHDRLRQQHLCPGRRARTGGHGDRTR